MTGHGFTQTGGTPQVRTAAAVVVILAVLVLAYANTFEASWHFDDEQNIVENKRLHLSELNWEQVRSTFFASPNGRGDLYRPVACLTFALNWYVGKDRVFGYHLVNLAVHFLASVFLFLFLHRSLRLSLLRDRYGDNAYPIALIATLLWAANPVQTQAVTYIVQRMASLAGMFTIAALYGYVRGRTAESPRAAAAGYLACAACGILAVGSKENAVMLPVSILLFDLLLVRGLSTLRGSRLLWLLPAAGLIAAAAAWVLRGPSIFDFQFLTEGYASRGFTLGERLLTQPRIVLFYVSLLLFPAPGRLSITHVIDPSQGLFDPPTTAASLLLIALAIALAVMWTKKRPLPSFCILFFFLNHLVESTVLPLELVYEHRNYIPSMFFFVPIAALAVRAAGKTGQPWRPPLVYGAISVLIASFAAGAHARNAAWQTEETLWLDALGKYPRSSRAYHNLGRAYADRGRYIEALYAYQMALQQPEATHGERRHVTHYNMGLIHHRLGDAAAAERHLQKSLAFSPEYADALTNMGVFVAVQGRYREAERYLRRAIRAKKRLQEAYTNLGYVLIKQGRYPEAADWLQRSLALNPQDVPAWTNLGIAYKKTGRYPEAEAAFSKALKKAPQAFLTRLHLTEVYLRTGEGKTARQTLLLGLSAMGPAQIDEALTVFDRLSPFDEPPDRDLVLPLLQELAEGKRR